MLERLQASARVGVSTGALALIVHGLTYIYCSVFSFPLSFSSLSSSSSSSSSSSFSPSPSSLAFFLLHLQNDCSVRSPGVNDVAPKSRQKTRYEWKPNLPMPLILFSFRSTLNSVGVGAVYYKE